MSGIHCLTKVVHTNDAAMAIATPTPEAKFQGYLERNLRYLLDLAATNELSPNTEMRIQAMHTLNYAFGAPEQWELTKELVLTLMPAMEQVDHRDHWVVYLKQAALLTVAQAIVHAAYAPVINSPAKGMA